MSLFAQEAVISGVVKDEDGQPVEAANIWIESLSSGTTTDEGGQFQVSVYSDTTFTLIVKHINYTEYTQRLNLDQGERRKLSIVLTQKVRNLQPVEIGADNENFMQQPSITKLDPIHVKLLPSPFNEFNKILATLPSVVSNNELSSSYSVRGGNFDENLVYVNDMLVYRPFLIRAGRQEGLSFINPDLVASVNFSAGGWQPRYGDKLSSSLNVTYKKPTTFSGSTTLSLLGASTHLEGASKNKRVRFLLGARYKSAQYLLGTLETKGQYLPRFGDIQGYMHFDLNKNSASKNTKSELGLLFSYAANRYLVRPEDRETNFGTSQDFLKLRVFFDGQEKQEYDTYQGGIKFTHWFSNLFRTNIIASALLTREREYFDIEGFYRLCDLEIDPNTPNIQQCGTVRGAGTYFDYGRNNLQAYIFNLENRSEYLLHENHKLEFGVGYTREIIEDDLREYSFTDSADFVTLHKFLDSDIHLNNNRLYTYIQNTSYINPVHILSYGVRMNYGSLNRQWLISPRLQYAINPRWKEDISFKMAVGLYQQPSFYRELRDFEGNINKDIKAQSSVHAIAGLDYNFQLWNRDFKFVTEVYYKYLYNVIPYDVDDVRIRYYGNNNATAYVTGIDFRINGEFVKGAESWFSLGILKTQEDYKGDNRGYIRRPSDQLINLGIFFQDHFPNNPTIRMYLNLLYGTGLPFGPPDNIDYRNSFDGSSYKRVDIGFSKIIIIPASFFKSIWIGVEVLNLLGSDNIISYIWIEDINGAQYGVPNSLSARFLNVKLQVKY